MNFWWTGYEITQYDAVIQVWLEKRRWDLIRPTTVIKRKGDELITTWAGPHKGIGEIRASDFESYHRVMPHSEYPSGSSCICFAVAQFTDMVLKDMFDYDDDLSIPIGYDLFNGVYIFYAGSSVIEPGTTPSSDLYLTMSSLQELSDTCAESRLWGAMHFTAAIVGGPQVCDGIGPAAYQYMADLLDGESL